jgi:hypothetical protein
VQFVGKGDGKSKGKGGFQGQWWACGDFGHSQRFCLKGKGKGLDKGAGKGYGKDNFKGGFQVKGLSKGYGWYGKGKGEFGKGGGAPLRACFGCGSTDHLLKDCPKAPGKVQQVVQEEEILFIGNVCDDWKKVPMKVIPTKAPDMMHKVKLNMTNRFKVLEVDEEDEEPRSHVFAVSVEEGGQVNELRFAKGGKAGQPSTRKDVGVASPYIDPEGMVDDLCKVHGIEKDWGNIKDQVQFVRAVNEGDGLVHLGKGDIIVDSAADESCWPAGHGDAFPTKPVAKELKLRTANGGEMRHYGEKHVTFKFDGAKGPVGLKFQVTDVKKPLLAVRRLVERGNVVMLSGLDGESYIYNREAKLKIPIVKKGGSFVIEAEFVQGFTGQA